MNLARAYYRRAFPNTSRGPTRLRERLPGTGIAPFGHGGAGRACARQAAARSRRRLRCVLWTFRGPAGVSERVARAARAHRRLPGTGIDDFGHGGAGRACAWQTKACSRRCLRHVLWTPRGPAGVSERVMRAARPRRRVPGTDAADFGHGGA